ncbi:right-handed parallel beta-helix repeat-containing protein [Ferruginibacter sp.]
MKTIQSPVRRFVFTTLSIITFFCCFAISGFATTYYISPAGNDVTGTGTLLNPWRTLKKATSTVNTTGDIIHVNTGVYTETQQCFLATGVSIEGDGVTSVLRSTVNTIYTALLEVRSNEGTNGNQHISNVKFDGTNLTTHWAVWIAGRSNVSMYNCTVVDFKDRGVIFSGRNDGIALPPASAYATGNKFYNNIVNNCADYNGYGRGCLEMGGQEGLLVYNNTITQNSRPSGQNGWPIKYTNEGWLKGVKIYNNTITKIPYANDGWSFALELFNAQGMEIYGNTIQGSLDFNYQGNKGIYPWAIYIHDNIIKQPAISTYQEEGIIFEYSTDGCIIENNIFENLNQQIVTYPRANTLMKDIIVRKNLFKNCGKTNSNDGYLIGGFGGALGPNWSIDNWEVYNNTFVAATTGNANPDFAINISYGGAFAVNGLKIKNNIIQGVRLNVMLTNDRSKFTNCQFQFNDFYGNGDNINLVPTWASSGIPFPASTTVSNNLTTNPMFVNNITYSLQVTSPLVDAGTNVGLPYMGAAPDRGYAEVSTALPVKLTAIKVTENKGKHILQWTTSTEINSSHFNIERSSNGQDYEVIGSVAATGFSSSEVNYNFTDAAPLTGINYYRLAMIDKDNSKEYSGIVSILSKAGQALNIVAAQLSSGKNNVKLTINSTQNQKANLVVFDQSGKIILNEQIVLQKGLNIINKNTLPIAKGIYYLKLFTNEVTVVKNVFSTE